MYILYYTHKETAAIDCIVQIFTKVCRMHSIDDLLNHICEYIVRSVLLQWFWEPD